MPALAPGSAVVTLAGTGFAAQVGAGNGPTGSPNLQPLRASFGVPNQTLLGNKPGLALGSWGTNTIPARQTIGGTLATLIGTTPYGVAVGYVGATAEGKGVAAALCQDWQISVSELAPGASFSATHRYWAPEIAGAAASALSLTEKDMLDGVLMQPIILLGGTHPRVKQFACGMHRTFDESGGRAANGFAASHPIDYTGFFITAEVYLGDGVSEIGSYDVVCGIVGTITAALTCSCIPVGDTAAAGLTMAFSNMRYDRAPGLTDRTCTISAISADYTSTCTLT